MTQSIRILRADRPADSHVVYHPDSFDAPPRPSQAQRTLDGKWRPLPDRPRTKALIWAATVVALVLSPALVAIAATKALAEDRMAWDRNAVRLCRSFDENQGCWIKGAASFCKHPRFRQGECVSIGDHSAPIVLGSAGSYWRVKLKDLGLGYVDKRLLMMDSTLLDYDPNQPNKRRP